MTDTEIATEAGLAAAKEFLAETLVIQGSELTLSRVGDGDRFLLDGFELSREIVDEWQRAGLHAVGVPVFCIGSDPYQGAVEQIARWNSRLLDLSDRVVRIGCVADVDRARAEGRVGVLLCMHFGGMFRTLDDVDYFYRLGQRSCVIVTHGQNAIGCPPGERHDGGLTHFGAGVVERMNTVGMAIDISHANERTAFDALDVSTRPIWANHTAAAALAPVPKNKSDGLMRAIGEKGGIIGIQPSAYLISSKPLVGVKELVDLADHVRNVAGEEAVALGFEEPWQGFAHLVGEHAPVGPTKWRRRGKTPPAPPAGPSPALHIPEMLRVDRYALLIAALMERGWDRSALTRFAGTNIRRFLEAQEAGRTETAYHSSVRASQINNGTVV